MKNYVLAFRGQPDRSAVAGEDEAWGAWFGLIGASIVDRGHRVAAAPTAGQRAEGRGGRLGGMLMYLVKGEVRAYEPVEDLAARAANGLHAFLAGERSAEALAP